MAESLSALGDRPALRHRRVAGTFSDRVRGTADWDVPAPVDGWTARDVVRHLCTWFPDFLAGGGGAALPAGPSVDHDPVAAWQHHADAVQAMLDAADPAAIFRHPMLPEMPLASAVDRFYTVDVFMHTWDLSRATGQDEHLDPALCADLLGGMQAMEEVLRGSGQYGPAVPVPVDADVQTRLLGFIGRDPDWKPAG